MVFHGILLGFASLQSLLTALMNKFWRGEMHKIVSDFFLFLCLAFSAIKSNT